MTERLRVLVADDELMARKRLLRLLDGLGGVEVLGECADGEEVLARVDAGDVDVLLLDIHMPRLTGTEAMGLLGPDGPLVVFVTAYAEHAVKAFDGGAVDYLLKPVEADRLAKALDRARERLGPRGAGGPPDRLPVPTSKGVELIPLEALSHAVIEGASLVLHTDRGRLFTDWRLADLERRLPTDRFERVHRQALVNLARVVRLEDTGTGGWLAHLDGGATVVVSRQSARELRRRWGL